MPNTFNWFKSSKCSIDYCLACFPAVTLPVLSLALPLFPLSFFISLFLHLPLSLSLAVTRNELEAARQPSSRNRLCLRFTWRAAAGVKEEGQGRRRERRPGDTWTPRGATNLSTCRTLCTPRRQQVANSALITAANQILKHTYRGKQGRESKKERQGMRERKWVKNASCLTLDEAWYEACGTLHSTVLILLMLPISSDGWQAQVCQGRCGEGEQKGGCLRAQLNMKYLRARPKLDGGWGAWKARVRSSCQKLWRKQRRNKGEREKGGRRGRRIAGGTETRLRRG